jgi:ATP-dependent DNA helicase RecG
LGSGIKRVLQAWPDIDFADDRDGCLFTATVHRKQEAHSDAIGAASVSPNLGEEGSEKSSEKIVALIRTEPRLSAREIAGRIGISPRAVEKQIAALKKDGRLRRIGPAKGGYWELSD